MSVPTWPPDVAARYRRLGHWTGQTLGDVVRDRARQHPERVAVVGGERRLTYRELDEAADRLAGGLAGLGIGAGDPVILQLPNVAEFLEVLVALLRLGAPPIMALPSHRASELRSFAEQTDAVAVVTCATHAGFDHRVLAARIRDEVPSVRHVVVAGDPGGHTALDDLRGAPYAGPGPRAADVALLQLSGGSSGTPKLIPRTHDDYLYSVRESARICGLDADTVYLCALPAAHNFPLSSPGTLGVLWAGGRVVFAPRPAPDEAFALIAAERVTITALVPPLAIAWTEAAGVLDHDLSSLELLQVGGAKLSEEAARRVRPALGCALQQVFGMAEGLVNYTRAEDPEEVVLTTQGRPISPDDEVLVVDEDDVPVPDGEVGHLLTRGPYTIRGYWRAPEHDRRVFTPDGFYRTGDLVRRTPTGHLVVEGRAKDQINRGGEKIAAEEVENHLLAHPSVLDAAVVAMPDRYLGERTCAFVVPRSEEASQRELVRFLRDRGLAAYKLPDRVEVVAELPRTAVGKVSKRALREAIARAVTTAT